jgi:hypothetical protein
MHTFWGYGMHGGMHQPIRGIGPHDLSKKSRMNQGTQKSAIYRYAPVCIATIKGI